MAWLPVVDYVLNEVVIAQAGTKYGPGDSATAAGSDWVLCKVAEGFNIWYYMTATGAPTVGLTFQYTIFRPGIGGTHDPDSTARDNFRGVSLGAALSTKGAWTHIDTPAEIRDYPFIAYRLKATENNVAAVTTFSVVVCRNGSSPV